MKKIGVFTSGGDSPGMNACIRAVVRTALYYKCEVFGIMRGYEGMIEGDIHPLGNSDVSYIIDKGGTVLFSARSKEFRTAEGRRKAHEQLQKHGIEALVAIGGDGTFTGATLFTEEFGIPVIGIPGTIDNDLFGTDFTLGFDTASNTAMQAIDKIRDTATSHNRLFLIEVMGRDAGNIALRCGLATGAVGILMPEKTDDYPRLIENLKRARNHKKRSNIVVVAEGDETGGAINLAKMINDVLPEYETRVTILGHIQRGGSPSAFDRELAGRMGVKAVESLLQGEKNKMLGWVNNRIVLMPLAQAIKEEPEINPEIIRIAEILSS